MVYSLQSISPTTSI